MSSESLSRCAVPSRYRDGSAAARRSRVSGAVKTVAATARPGADIRIVKRIHHRWTDVFRLVLDVESYPAFVPYCRDVHLLSRTSGSETSTILVSRMSVGFAALQVDYATRTIGDLKSRRIDINAIDGPLRYLRAVWR